MKPVDCLVRASVVLIIFGKVAAWAAPADDPSQPAGLTLSFERPHMLVIHDRRGAGQEIRVNYLEAYCRAGSTDADWSQHTVIPHRVDVISLDEERHTLRLRDTLADGVTVEHTVTAGDDEVSFELRAHNPTSTRSEAHWAQACVRVGEFAGFDPQGQDLDDYLPKCFVFLNGKLTRLSEVHPWATQARYTPGQVWRAPGVPRTDVNPRPLSDLVPDLGLIGAFSKDERRIVATAWEPYQELFQGVARCLHADFRLGGLHPNQTRRIHGKLYLVPNDVPALVARYRRDFPEHQTVAAPGALPGAGGTIVVAARDAAPESRSAARFVADGENDQEEINAAIRALPPAGGTVLLSEGTFDIRRVGASLGGVLIERSHVTLTGQGAATQLVLAANQDVNVIRIIGSGVGHITIRDLCVNANREHNRQGQGDPNVSHSRFEFCGIKAFRQMPAGPTAAEDTHDITIRNCRVTEAHRLGIMLEGPNMQVVDNFLGNAGSDAVEILTGPGMIRGNTVEITGPTHVAIGSDRANSISMSDNIVRVRQGGKLGIGFRSWAGSKRHVIANNIMTVDAGGRCDLAMDIRGTETTVTGNQIHSTDPASPTRVRIAAGNAVVTGNVLENAVIEVDDQTDVNLPIRLEANILRGTNLVLRKGNVVPPAATRGGP